MQYLLASIVAVFAVWFQAGSDLQPIEGFIEAELSSTGLPGVSYAIVENGELISGAHGEVDLRTGVRVTADTPFQLASISKSFTAVAILQLVEAGEVELDGALSQYLDAFQASPGRAITIRQLLGHTSGYSTLQGNETHVERANSDDALSRQIQLIASWVPAAAPGEQWDYSNANYLLLGGVIESVSGLKYDQYVEMNILEPIGMKNSFVGDGGTYTGVAVAHKPWFGGKRPAKDTDTITARASASAGGVIASAHDLGLYLEMLLNGRDDIIRADNKALMMQPASAQAPNYGLGWMLNVYDGTVYHSGLNPGTESLAILVPAERKSVVVLVNASSGFGFGETTNLMNGISAIALGRDFVPDRGSFGRKSLFLTFALLPLLFLVGAIQAWFGRGGLREKSGAFGLFSLWFPFVMTSTLAWVSVSLIPNLFGVSLSTLVVFSPDLAIVLFATAVSGLIWAVFRLLVYYSAMIRPSTP